MSIKEEQCNKVCKILDDVLANRPTERDSLIVAVRKAFEALELFGISEQPPSAQPKIVRCKDCKWKQGSECVRFAEVRPFPDDFCSRAERRKQ